MINVINHQNRWNDNSIWNSSNAKNLNTCRNLKLQYTRRRTFGDCIQHYLFYRLYPIKQTFLSARIAKLTETFNYWSQIKLHVTKCVCLLLDTKVLKRNLAIFKQKFFRSIIFAEILICSSQKKHVSHNLILRFDSGNIYFKLKWNLWTADAYRSAQKCLLYGGVQNLEFESELESFMWFCLSYSF